MDGDLAMDKDDEGVLASTLEALSDAAKASVEVAKSAQEVVADAAKATVEAGREMVSTAPSAFSEAVAGTTEKPRKAKRARGSTKKRASAAADLARLPENLRPKNPLARSRRRDEKARRNNAGVLRRTPEGARGAAANTLELEMGRDIRLDTTP